MHSKEKDLNQSLTEDDSHIPNVVMPDSAYSNLPHANHHHFHHHQQHKGPHQSHKYYHHEPPHIALSHHDLQPIHHDPPVLHHDHTPVYHNFHHDPSPHHPRNSRHRQNHSYHYIKPENFDENLSHPPRYEFNNHDEMNTTIRSRASRSLNRNSNLNII